MPTAVYDIVCADIDSSLQFTDMHQSTI